jgi:hypothetical protein
MISQVWSLQEAVLLYRWYRSPGVFAWDGCEVVSLRPLVLRLVVELLLKLADCAVLLRHLEGRERLRTPKHGSLNGTALHSKQHFEENCTDRLLQVHGQVSA